MPRRPLFRQTVLCLFHCVLARRRPITGRHNLGRYHISSGRRPPRPVQSQSCLSALFSAAVKSHRIICRSRTARFRTSSLPSFLPSLILCLPVANETPLNSLPESGILVDSAPVPATAKSPSAPTTEMSPEMVSYRTNGRRHLVELSCKAE